MIELCSGRCDPPEWCSKYNGDAASCNNAYIKRNNDQGYATCFVDGQSCKARAGENFDCPDMPPSPPPASPDPSPPVPPPPSPPPSPPPPAAYFQGDFGKDCDGSARL